MKLTRIGTIAMVAASLVAASLPAQEAGQKSEAEWNAQKVEAKRSQIDATVGGALDKLL